MSWIVAGVTAAVGAYSAYSSGKAASGQGESQSRLSQLEIDEAKEALNKLEPVRAAKMQVAQQEFQFGSEAFGIKKMDAQQQLSTAIQKSGLVTSAGITQKKSSMWKQFEHGQKGLMGEFGKAMGGIEEWFEGEKSRIEGVQKRAGLQKKAADEQSGSWYLGKNIFG
tara:strand:+ start:581 stop:1081 length:501 start_codon:yes stop_codon:yes gene_type:complete